MPAAAVVGGAAILGGIAGSQKDKAQTSSQSNQQSQLVAAPITEDEKRARSLALDSLESLNARLSAIEASPTLSRLDQLLKELGEGPSADRIKQANQFAADIYQGQQVALDQEFEDQTTQYAQRAAQMGRSSADPILAAKLAQEQVRQRARLNAEQGSFAASEAVNAPARQFNNLLGGVNAMSQQAIQNRQAVYSLGSDFANTLQQYRLATGVQYGSASGNQTTTSGGGFKGALTGLIGGAAGGVKMGQGAGLFG